MQLRDGDFFAEPETQRPGRRDRLPRVAHSRLALPVSLRRAQSSSRALQCLRYRL
jgi:hypothetical protein